MKRRRPIHISCKLNLYTCYTLTWSLHILNQFLLEFHGFFSSPIHITITSVAELNITPIDSRAQKFRSSGKQDRKEIAMSPDSTLEMRDKNPS